MLFNSKIFVAFLAIVLAVYYLLGDRAKIWFLLVVSYVYYAFWSPWLSLLLSFCIVFNFEVGRRMAAARGDDRRRKRLLWLVIVGNIGVLSVFKYTDFFIREFCSASALLGQPLDPNDYLLHLVVPIGLSFYTFQTMSYTLDLYRGVIQEPETDPVRFALFVSFFPQHLAGPVERATHLLPQFSRPFRLSRAMVTEGVFQILLGFAKKVIIADRLGRIIAPYYRDPHITGPVAAAAMLVFTCQIYVDFSSYSDIAIGLGKILGYNIRPNFNLPFVVPSIPERWRRWHLSMSEWFRDYIFIPLGGSRLGTVRTQINILIVMLISGLWHGASNNFLVWGLLNGLTMVGHRMFLRPLRAVSGWMERRRLTRVLYFYLCCWVTFCTIASINIFFRCPDWSSAKTFLHAIYGSGLQPWSAALAAWRHFPTELQTGFAWILVVFCVHEAERYLQLQRRLNERPWAWSAVCLFFFWAVVTFGVSGTQFIYYQF